SLAMHQEALAEHEAALATFKALMDTVRFEAGLDRAKARQRLEQAQTAVRVAREHLKMLGVAPDESGAEGIARKPGADSAAGAGGGEPPPIVPYEIRAPFDGTILDRELVVPGVFVDTTHRIFTIADLSKVWIQVKVQEAEFGELVQQRGGHL